MRTLLATAHHRNGVGGVPVNLAIFEDTEEPGHRFIGIQFETDLEADPYHTHTAVFAIDLLAKALETPIPPEAIEFAMGNSWRGDYYAQWLFNRQPWSNGEPDIAFTTEPDRELIAELIEPWNAHVREPDPDLIDGPAPEPDDGES